MRTGRASRALSLAATGAIVLALVACGNTTTTTTNASGQVVTTCHISFAKTKFLLHAGLATGAFHRWIYKPFRAGSFKSGAPGRTAALAKAAATALFVYHELKVAGEDAKCDGPALRKIASPFSSAASALSSLKGAISGGNLGAIGGAATTLDGLVGKAAQNGIQIKDH